MPLFQKLDEGNRLILAVSEESKTLEGVGQIYESLIQRSAKKNITLVAIGGGILQDIVGFAASTIYRGIRWIYVPTTLLAQSDSCIGGKTSINYKSYKNLLGTFYPPFEIHILPEFLNTLTKVDFYSGLGEVVKLHLIEGAQKTAWYAKHQISIRQREPKNVMQSIRNSLDIKISYIKEDEFDQGKRNMLNFGHCYGHALESVSHFEIPHGQAVLMGILFAGVVASLRGLQTAEFEHTISQLVQAHIVCRITLDHFNADKLVAAMKKDKKRTGKGLAVIIMSEAHEMIRISDLTEQEFKTAHVEIVNRLVAPLAAPDLR